MHTVAESVPATGEPWYADHGEVVALASVLVDADWLSTPHDVVDFFERPWKWDNLFRIWADASRPRPPSSDDLAQARWLGPGTMRRELERRYKDDCARWESLIAAFDASDAGGELSARDERGADNRASRVRR